MSLRRIWRNITECAETTFEVIRNLFEWLGDLCEEYLQPSRFASTRRRWILYHVSGGMFGIILIGVGYLGSRYRVYIVQDMGYTFGTLIDLIALYCLVCVPYNRESGNQFGELVAVFRRVLNRMPSSSNVVWSDNENFVEFPPEEYEPLMHQHQPQPQPGPSRPQPQPGPSRPQPQPGPSRPQPQPGPSRPQPHPGPSRPQPPSDLNLPRPGPSRRVERNPSCRSPECTPRRKHPSAPGDLEWSRHGAQARARARASAAASAASGGTDEMLELQEDDFDLPRPSIFHVPVNIDDIRLQPPGSAFFPTSTPSTSRDHIILLQSPRRPAPAYFRRHDTNCPTVRPFTRQFNRLLNRGAVTFADLMIRDIPFPFRAMSLPSIPLTTNDTIRNWWNTLMRTFSERSREFESYDSDKK